MSSIRMQPRWKLIVTHRTFRNTPLRGCETLGSASRANSTERSATSETLFGAVIRNSLVRPRRSTDFFTQHREECRQHRSHHGTKKQSDKSKRFDPAENKEQQNHGVKFHPA